MMIVVSEIICSARADIVFPSKTKKFIFRLHNLF